MNGTIKGLIIKPKRSKKGRFPYVIRGFSWLFKFFFFFRDLKEPIKEWKKKLGTPLLDSPENSKKHLELIQGIRASKRHNHTEMI